MNALKFALIVALLATVPAHAEPKMLVAKSTDMELRITTEPCTSEKVQMLILQIAPSMIDDFRAGSETWRGKDYELCWTALDDKHLLIVDEAGDAGAVPMKLFKPEEGI